MVPEIGAGVAEIAVTAVNVLQTCALTPHAFTAFTQMLPPVNMLENVTLILLLVDVPVALLGNIHWYDVAPATASVVNTKL